MQEERFTTTAPETYAEPSGVEVTGITRQDESNGSGQYFRFSESDWEDEFGSFEYGGEKSITQCRDSQPIRTGEVIVWDSSEEAGTCRRRSCKGVHGRYTKPETSAGDWQPDDYIVASNSQCVTN